ncbi:MAG TPA: GNAT family N-acetyltransferase [Geomonas sp.]|nr:GNAT family N-acetyltransferase [Geomonas sp.]
MRVEIVNPAQEPEWDRKILATRGYCCFHTSAWASVLADSFQYQPRYFILQEQGALRGLLPMMEVRSLPTGRRGVSLSFTDYCEPIAADQEAFGALFDAVLAYGRQAGWQYVELRGGRRFLPEAPAFARYLHHQLPLQGGEQELLAAFHLNTRRGIKKAAGLGLSVRFDNSLQSVRDFYRLHAMTRKRHGVPPQPFQFFARIHELILKRNLGWVVLASGAGENVAGAVFFHFGDQALYKFGASDPRYWKLYPNDLVMWEAIRKYLQLGYRELSFGRTECDNDGLRRFKASWGSTESELSYYRYDLKAGRFLAEEADRLGHYAGYLKKLPEPVLGIIGQLLYRHMG